MLSILKLKNESTIVKSDQLTTQPKVFFFFKPKEMKLYQQLPELLERDYNTKKMLFDRKACLRIIKSNTKVEKKSYNILSIHNKYLNFVFVFYEKIT